MKHVLKPTIMLIVLFWASIVHGNEPPPLNKKTSSFEPTEKEAKKEAKKHFKRGTRFFINSDLEKAVHEFRAAFELAPSWRLHYNIAQCEAELKNYGKAIEEFEKYIGAGGDDIDTKRQDNVLKELTRLKQMVGKITIETDDTFEIFINGELRGKTPITGGIMLPIGMEHKIEFKQPTSNKTVKVYQVSVSGGETVPLVVKPAQKEPKVSKAQPKKKPAAPKKTANVSKPPPPLVALKKKPLKPTLFILSLSVGFIAASITTGLVIGVNSKWKDATERYNENPWGYDYNQNDAIRKMQVTSYIIGSVSVIAFIGALLTIPFTQFEKETVRHSKLSPIFAPHYGGLSWRRTF